MSADRVGPDVTAGEDRPGRAPAPPSAEAGIGARATAARGRHEARELLRVEGVRAGYVPGNDVLRDLAFAVHGGESVGVLAPNGGGKTTLFRTLLGELEPTAGTVALHCTVATVPQGDHARLDFPVSALDVTLMGAYSRTPWWRRITRSDRDRARQALDRVGLLDRADHRYGTLSGGQRRRTLIARALLQDARTLLLDEPFAGVDRASEDRILQVLDELTSEGRALLIATHDVEQARRWDKVLCLNGRQIAFGPPERVLTAAILRETYGAELVVVGDDQAVCAPHHDCGDHA